MTLLENIRIALRSIRGNLLRASLTFLIIAFGIMALVGILTSIDGIKVALNDNFSLMGANTFNIVPKGTGIQTGGRDGEIIAGDPISYREAIAFKERYMFPATASVSALGSSGGTVKAGDKETSPNVTIYGADENYLLVAGYELEAGRNLTLSEAQIGSSVAIIGMDVVKSLFGSSEKALGQMIVVRGARYRVIGVLKEKGSSVSFAGDRIVILPLAKVKQVFGSQTDSYNLSVSVPNVLDMEAAIAEAIGIFRGIRGIAIGKEEDFETEKSDSLSELIVENTAYLRAAAVIIGVITLFGAAIGLMNIMLVSVTERTREIGVRKSLGATRRNVLIQFLTEAVVICQIGGILGIVFGILVGNGVTSLVGGAFIIPWAWMLLGFSLCMVVGLVAGIYPAYRAAALDPIEALRYE